MENASGFKEPCDIMQLEMTYKRFKILPTKNNGMTANGFPESINMHHATK